MDITFINTLAGGVIVQISVALATVVGSVILVWGAFIGLGFIKRFVNGWIAGHPPRYKGRSWEIKDVLIDGETLDQRNRRFAIMIANSKIREWGTGTRSLDELNNL